jgi:hypothetical protein
MTEIKIFADNIPFTGTLFVELFQLEAETGGNPRTEKSMSVFFTDIQAITSEILLQNDTEETEIQVRENAVSDGGTIDIKPVDLPQIANSSLVFSNGNYYYNGTYILTKLWKNNSGDPISFQDVLKNQILNYYGQPRQIISGCVWRGEGLHMESVAQHILNAQRKFIADHGTWNILDDDFDLIWIEQPGSASASGLEWILEDALWGDHGEIWMDEETWEDSDV